MGLFLERHFLLFTKMNEASWSLWVRQSESRTCHEAHVRPGIHMRVTSLPRCPECYIRALKKGNSQTAQVQEPFGLFLKCSASPVNISILKSGQIIIIVCVSASLRSLSGYHALHPGSLSLPRCCCLQREVPDKLCVF